MLQIWGRRNALNVQKVMWLVDELKIPNWYKWLQERSAYREYVMVSFSDMKGRLDS